MATKKTWRRSSGLASFEYRLHLAEDAHEPSRRREWLASVVERLLMILDGFAEPTRIEGSTLRDGEDAFVAELSSAQARTQALTLLKAGADVTQLDIDLALQCYDLTDSGEVVTVLLADGALTLLLSLAPDGHLRSDRLNPIRLILTLDCDIYAPLSWGAERDNRVLAAHNGPLLRDFLLRLERELPVALLAIDAPDYANQVGRHGFDLP